LRFAISPRGAKPPDRHNLCTNQEQTAIRLYGTVSGLTIERAGAFRGLSDFAAIDRIFRADDPQAGRAALRLTPKLRERAQRVSHAIGVSRRSGERERV
jgi:hypothetical protein